jgi:hypothetical protein
MQRVKIIEEQEDKYKEAVERFEQEMEMKTLST